MIFQEGSERTVHERSSDLHPSPIRWISQRHRPSPGYPFVLHLKHTFLLLPNVSKKIFSALLSPPIRSVHAARVSTCCRLQPSELERDRNARNSSCIQLLFALADIRRAVPVVHRVGIHYRSVSALFFSFMLSKLKFSNIEFGLMNGR